MRIESERSIVHLAVLILPLAVSACWTGVHGETAPVPVSGCAPQDYFNPCITKDTTTDNRRTAVCHSIPDGWAFRANRYLLSRTKQGWTRVTPRTGTPKKWETCNHFARQGRFVEGEFALTPSTHTAFTTAIGDICSEQPIIVVHRFEGDWLLALNTGGRGQNHERFRNPMYDFYVGAHNARWIRGNMVDLRLLGFKRLLKKQCGALPEKVRVLGRLAKLPKRNSKNVAYAPKQIYAGTFYPKAIGYKLIPDDHSVADALREVGLAHRRKQQEGLAAARARFEQKMQKQALGGLLVFLGLYAAYASSPCNDPDLSDAERPYYCD